MHVLILSLTGYHNIAIQLKDLLSKIETDAEIQELTEQWDHKIYRKLQNSTHLILVMSNGFFNAPACVFSLGYGMGKELPIFLFMQQKAKLPDSLSKVYRTDSLTDLISFFQGEKKIWLEEQSKKMAREALIGLGLSLTQETFVNCVMEGETEAVRYFLQAGFSANTVDKKGVPLVCLAARYKHRNLLALLIDNYGDLDAVSLDRGNTALMDAAADKNADIIQDLIERGASPDIRSKNGQTALILAVGQGAEEAAILLINAGADINIKDNLGMSAKKYAELFKLEKILSLMERTS